MDLIKTVCGLFILLFIVNCAGIAVNNPAPVKIKIDTGHPHNTTSVIVPVLNKESNAVVKVDGLTPAPANVPKNSTAINVSPNSVVSEQKETITTAPANNTSRQNRGGSGCTSGPVPTFKEGNTEIIINDIVLTGSGVSIMENDKPEFCQLHGQAAIEPDFSGKEIFLTIKGSFKTSPEMNLDNILFTNEPGLLHQSVVEQEPKLMVVMDDVILFSALSASPTEIKVKIDTRGIPDFYLKGNHKFSIKTPNLSADTKIKVGEPVPVTSLSPVISSVEVLKDSNNNPVNLLVKGKNLMLNPKFSYAQVDGVFGFGHQTNITFADSDTNWEAIIHIPDISDFKSKNEHTISYSTPFGVAFKGY